MLRYQSVGGNFPFDRCFQLMLDPLHCTMKAYAGVTSTTSWQPTKDSIKHPQTCVSALPPDQSARRYVCVSMLYIVVFSQVRVCACCVQVAGVQYFHTSGSFNSAVLLNPDGTTAAINPGATYTIVSTDYMLQGGDGYDFKDAEVLLPAGLPYAEQVMEDLKLFPQGVSAELDCCMQCVKFSVHVCHLW